MRDLRNVYGTYNNKKHTTDEVFQKWIKYTVIANDTKAGDII